MCLLFSVTFRLNLFVKTRLGSSMIILQQRHPEHMRDTLQVCTQRSYPFMHTGIWSSKQARQATANTPRALNPELAVQCQCQDQNKPGAQCRWTNLEPASRRETVIQFQNRLPPRLMGCRSPGPEAVPLLIWAASFFRSCSLSSSEDGARGFDFLMGRTGDESVSDGGALVTLRFRAPPTFFDGVGDRMRISGG